MQMFITAREMNGETHDLGWFAEESSMGEAKRQASDRMSVPSEAIRFASCCEISSGASLNDEQSTLGDVLPRFGGGLILAVVVQMPSRFEEVLQRRDDIRVHEKAYEDLAKFVCQFEGRFITPANANLVRRAIDIISKSLHGHCHTLSRGWAIAALSKILQYVSKQLHRCHCRTRGVCTMTNSLEALKGAMVAVVEALLDVSEVGFWLEREEALSALARLNLAQLFKVDSELHRHVLHICGQSRPGLGGA
jgi:hypothetical protein